MHNKCHSSVYYLETSIRFQAKTPSEKCPSYGTFCRSFCLKVNDCFIALQNTSFVIKSQNITRKIHNKCLSTVHYLETSIRFGAETPAKRPSNGNFCKISASK